MRYEIMANTVIKIDLHNNYSVVAFAKWNVEAEKYSVDLYIKENTIDHLDLLDDYKNIIFESDIKSIKTDITKHIETLYNEGKIERYIKRSEYELKCFNIGNEIISTSKGV